MLTVGHSLSGVLSFLSYNDGTVTIKNLDPTIELTPEITTMSLATFLREIGIPFKAVRALTSGERVEEVVAG